MWKRHPETKEIEKLQQQFSDLKQWRLNEVSRETDSESENTDEETSSEEDVQTHNPFKLLEQEY